MSDSTELQNLSEGDTDSTSNLLSPQGGRRTYSGASMSDVEPDLRAHSVQQVPPPRARGNAQPSAQRRTSGNNAQPQRRPPPAAGDDQGMTAEMKYGADSVVKLIKPVSICMLVVVAIIRSVQYFSVNDTTFAYTPFERESASGGEKFGGALLNALIFIGIIVVMTILLVTCYKYKCYKVIHGWLILSSVLLLCFFSYLYFTQVLDAQNATIDWVSMSFTIWNFGLVGLMMVHWRGPLLAQQFYLIAISALMALVLIKNLPEWTAWVIIALVAVYDLVAVLSPCGPLKWLVELSQDRDESLFQALTYNSGMMWIVTMAHETNGNLGESSEERRARHARNARPPVAGDVPINIDEQPRRGQTRPAQGRPVPQNAQRPVQRPPPPEEDDDEESGVKLGLGDFIFYSVLVGKAATANEWTTITACFISVLIGLACTLFILSIVRKALPALPISIAVGLLFYFVTSEAIDPLINRLNEHQVFF